MIFPELKKSMYKVKINIIETTYMKQCNPTKTSKTP